MTYDIIALFYLKFMMSHYWPGHCEVCERIVLFVIVEHSTDTRCWVTSFPFSEALLAQSKSSYLKRIL